MKAVLPAFLFIALLMSAVSCRTLNSSQTRLVRQFAVTAGESCELPYQVMHNYYTVKFKRKQLVPENYVTGDTSKAEQDAVAENVISRLEEIRDEYFEDLETASEIKSVYELLGVYVHSLEALSDDKYSDELEKQSAQLGSRMGALTSRINNSSRTKTMLSLRPAEWLSSLITTHGRLNLKARQAALLKEYISQADTLVQAINRNYQEIQLPIMKSWFAEESTMIRDQFKRTIAPYLQTINRRPDSTAALVAIEFYSKINPVYYELTDEVYRNQTLINQTGTLMANLASMHRSLKSLFDDGGNWRSVSEQLDGLKDQLSVLQTLFGKTGQEKFSFYKNFLIQNEKSFKNIIDKR